MSKRERKQLTAEIIKAIKKAQELQKIRKEMNTPKPKYIYSKGTHYHEEERPFNSNFPPDAQWIKDKGWNKE